MEMDCSLEKSSWKYCSNLIVVFATFKKITVCLPLGVLGVHCNCVGEKVPILSSNFSTVLTQTVNLKYP